MVDFDTSSPKSKAVKQLLDAYISLDLNNLKPLISKDYQYEPLPKSPDTDTANQGKEDHIQKWGEIFSLLTKFDVRILRRRTAFKLNLIDIRNFPR